MTQTMLIIDDEEIVLNIHHPEKIGLILNRNNLYQLKLR